MAAVATDTLSIATGSLLDLANRYLIESERPAGMVSLVPGNSVVIDNCCEGGGQLWVRIVSVVPQPANSQPCDTTHARVRVALGVARCQAGLKDDGSGPTGAELMADGLAMGQDQAILLKAIRDWTDDPGFPGQYVPTKGMVIEQGTPLPSTGYCGGWEWTLTFLLLFGVPATT